MGKGDSGKKAAGNKATPVRVRRAERSANAQDGHGAIVSARPRIVLSVGDRVRSARDLQEMTQEELAAASGISQPAISAIESGRVELGVRVTTDREMRAVDRRV
jgi:ribosome-binding protein aMBF1 (putative translation factor)